MDAALDPSAWRDWFVATAGIGAALAGLVFVALSINLGAILKLPSVVGRGAESLVVLLSIAAVAVVGLWPADRTWVALGLLVVGVVAWAMVSYLALRPGAADGATAGQNASRIVLGQIATLPTILAGASLLVGAGPGLHLVVLGTLACIVSGVVGAWVLLVEILR